jgi:hypothetical protein
MDLDPDFCLGVVVLAEPGVEAFGIAEFAHLGGIDLDRRHQRVRLFAVVIGSSLSLLSSDRMEQQWPCCKAGGTASLSPPQAIAVLPVVL